MGYDAPLAMLLGVDSHSLTPLLMSQGHVLWTLLLLGRTSCPYISSFGSNLTYHYHQKYLRA